MVKKVKRYEEGGYTGDDPIVKYRMGIKDKEAEPEFETKTGKNEAISDDIRARAMKFVEKSDEAKKEVTPKSTAVSRKAVVKAKESTPVMDAEERKRESQALLNRAPAPKFDPVAAAGLRRPTPAPDFMMKSMGYKSGGKVKSASSRADGCAIRGKTRA